MVSQDTVAQRAVALGRRALGLDVPEPPHTVAALHGDETEAPGLSPRELLQLRNIRLFGATGTVLMAVGAAGAATQPVLQNPTQGVRILGLFSRVLTTSLVMCITGTVMVVMAWLLLGRYAVGDFRHPRPARRLTRSQLDRTLLLWILPLSVAPPLFSRDVYSYLAQSEIAAMGLDPYKLGPAQALGVGHVLTRTVPTIWRDTPAPYGPLSLWAGRGIAELTGHNILAGIFMHRLLALIGVALIVWALPRLAHSCGVSEVNALWLGAANPLVLFHLVSGVHNEALMLGLMLAGLVPALHVITGSEPLRGRNLAGLVGGVGLIALSSTVKIPSLIALGFVGLALARRWALRRPDRRLLQLIGASVLMSVIAGVVTLLVSDLSGLGMGWIHTLGTANEVRSWLSLPTSIGVITGFGGVLLGLGDHTTSVLGLTRSLALLAAAFFALRMMVATYTGRLPAAGALGVAFGAIVMLFPVVQPWYLLWALIPLAAWASTPAFRIPAIALSSLVGILLLPSGSDYLPAYSVVLAVLAAVVTLVVLMLVTRNALPWRGATPATLTT